MKWTPGWQCGEGWFEQTFCCQTCAQNMFEAVSYDRSNMTKIEFLNTTESHDNDKQQQVPQNECGTFQLAQAGEGLDRFGFWWVTR